MEGSGTAPHAPSLKENKMLRKASPWAQKRATTVMFSLGFGGGRTAYMVVPQEAVAAGDDNVLKLARERQARGEVPAGDIISVKRVR